jgi:hypothetical protein
MCKRMHIHIHKHKHKHIRKHIHIHRHMYECTMKIIAMIASQHTHTHTHKHTHTRSYTLSLSHTHERTLSIIALIAGQHTPQKSMPSCCFSSLASVCSDVLLPNMRGEVYVYVYVYVHACMCGCVSVCVCIYIHICTHICACVRSHPLALLRRADGYLTPCVCVPASVVCCCWSGGSVDCPYLFSSARTAECRSERTRLDRGKPLGVALE